MKLKSIVVASAVCLLGLNVSAFASVGSESKTDPRGDMQQLQMRSSQIEATLNKNEGSVLAGKPYLADDWTKRITVSGELNVDGKWRSKHGPTGTGTNENSLFQNTHYSDIYLNNSQFDIDAYVNSWTSAHISVAGRDPMLINKNYQYKSDVVDGSKINLDEAYVTIGNLDQYPVYGTFGRQYVPFGVYDRHPIEPSLTQYLSQTQATAAKVGFAMPMGLYGSAYTFRGKSKYVGDTELYDNAEYQINNYGGEVGFMSNYTVGDMPFDYGLSVGYLGDMRDVDYISAMSTPRNNHAVGGLSVDGHVKTGPFTLRANYVTALSDFETVTSGDQVLNGDKPWAYGVAGDYDFDVMGHDSTFTLMFQQAGDVEDLGLPKRRYGGQYRVGVLKDTDVTFLVVQDKNFDNYLDTGTPKVSEHATEAAIRLSVDF